MDGQTDRAVTLTILCALALGQASCALSGPPPGNPVRPVTDTTGPLAPGGGSNGAGSVIGAGGGASSSRHNK
jgi:hypothetical protein